MKFDIGIEKLSKGLKNPKSPFMQPLGELEDFLQKPSTSLQDEQFKIYLWGQQLFATSRTIDMLIHSQKKYMVQCLIWSDSFVTKKNAPLASFSIRAFLETAAHFNFAFTKFSESYENYKKKVSDEFYNLTRLDDDEFVDKWCGFLHDNMYIPLLAHCMPTTLKFEEKKRFEAIRNNESIEIEKGHLLKPNNIKTKLKKLEKNVKGLRPLFETLSEFIHPNSFPLNQYTTLKKAKDGLLYCFFEDNHDFFDAFVEHLNRFPETIMDTVSHTILLEKSLLAIKRNLEIDIKKVVRYSFRYSLPDEKFNQTCVCGSGKLLKKCCAKR